MSQDRIRITGEFESADMEAAYRQRYARHELKIGRVIVVSAAITVIGFTAVDHALVADRTMLIFLWSARGFFVALSAIALLLFRGNPSYRAFERIYFSWYCSTVAMHLLAGTLWPAGHSESRMAGVLSVLMVYCISPLQLRWQIGGALLQSFASLLIVAGLNPPADVSSIRSDLCWHSVINVLGVYLSQRSQVRHRQLYAAMRRQSELSATLGHSLAEIRTLRGLIRVCSWCKKVDTGTFWQQMESYVRDHSHAEFTHGICPACLPALIEKTGV